MQVIVPGNLLRLCLMLTACGAAAAEPLVVAHRGSTVTEPENTLAALHWAVRAGADIVELDVRRTMDGHLVVIHDKRVNRTTDGSGYVHKMTLAQIRTLDAGRGERVPTLTQILDSAAMQDVRLLLDVKDSRRIDPHRLAGMVHDHPMRSRVIVGSRSVEFLGAVQARYPDLLVLGFVPKRVHIEQFLALEVHVIRLRAPWVLRQPELVEYVHRNGALVWVNTGTRKGSRLEAVLPEVVDGVITDRPLELLAVARGN